MMKAFSVKGPPICGKQVVDRREEGAGGAHEGGAEAERDVRDPLRVDAHQGRGARVLRRRADHPAEVRVAEEEEQRAAEGERDPEGDEHREAEGERDRLAAHLHVPVDRLRRVGDGDGAVVGGEREEGEVREDEADPDREEHLVLRQDRLGLHDRGDEPFLEHRPEDEEHGNDDEERDVRVDLSERERPERDVHADHHQLAVREVDDLHDAHDQGHPEPDQGVEPTEQDPRDEDLPEQLDLTGDLWRHGITPVGAGALLAVAPARRRDRRRGPRRGPSATPSRTSSSATGRRASPSCSGS